MILLAFARPIDHDESQYVAATVLGAHAWPYRDFAYLQTPLQPLLFAPAVAAAGAYAFVALRLINAVLGAAAIGLVYIGVRAAGAGGRAALVAAGLLATCDVLLFSATVARNDALPAALLALALWRALAAGEGRASRIDAAVVGLALGAAAAAKLSYAVPAAAFGMVALADRRRRPGWVAAGAALPLLLVAASWAAAPQAFAFEVLRFPTVAPAQYYGIDGRGWKLTLAGRAIDTIKFLSLGPALLALVLVARDRRRRTPRVFLLEAMIVAGLIAALLPAPTWRQYLLPLLPPLFVRLALAWEARPPNAPARVLAIVFACAGLAPSAATLIDASRSGLPLAAAMREGRALGRAMDTAGVSGAVASLSPQFVPASGRAIDPRFAAGPFYFRSQGLLGEESERALHLVSRAHLHLLAADPPAAIVTGAEAWTSGDPALDRRLDRWARAMGYRQVPVAGRLRLYVRPR